MDTPYNLHMDKLDWSPDEDLKPEFEFECIEHNRYLWILWRKKLSDREWYVEVDHAGIVFTATAPHWTQALTQALTASGLNFKVR
jgi:hypothetical protein